MRTKIGSKRAGQYVMFIVVGEQCILELIKISNFWYIVMSKKWICMRVIYFVINYLGRFKFTNMEC